MWKRTTQKLRLFLKQLRQQSKTTQGTELTLLLSKCHHQPWLHLKSKWAPCQIRPVISLAPLPLQPSLHQQHHLQHHHHQRQQEQKPLAPTLGLVAGCPGRSGATWWALRADRGCRERMQYLNVLFLQQQQ